MILPHLATLPYTFINRKTDETLDFVFFCPLIGAFCMISIIGQTRWLGDRKP